MFKTKIEDIDSPLTLHFTGRGSAALHHASDLVR
jgi:hypothetical protein